MIYVVRLLLKFSTICGNCVACQRLIEVKLRALESEQLLSGCEYIKENGLFHVLTYKIFLQQCLHNCPDYKKVAMENGVVVMENGVTLRTKKIAEICFECNNFSGNLFVMFVYTYISYKNS